MQKMILEFEIRSPYANLKAKVVPLPFFDPKKTNSNKIIYVFK